MSKIANSHRLPERKGMTRSTSILVFAMLIVSSSLLLGAGIHHEHDWGDDFAAYIMQARSLVEGNSSALLAETRFMIEQSSSFWVPVAYPWGFPTLLSPLYALFGVNMLALKMVNLVCYLGFLAVVWFAWPRCHSNTSRFVFVALFAWNSFLQEFMNQVLSDIPFLLFSTLSIILIGRVVIELRWLISQSWDPVLLGLVITASCFIRANGFLLVVILILTLFIRAMQHAREAHGMTSSTGAQLRSLVSRVPRLRATHLLGVLIVAVWVWQVLWSKEQYFFSGDASLTHVTMALLLERLHYNIELPTQFFTGVPHPDLVYGATIPLAMIGMVRRRGSDYRMIWYAVLTVLLYILTLPTTQGLRYLFPILPLYIHFVLVRLEQCLGVTNHNRTTPRRWVRWVPAFLVLFYFAETAVVNAALTHAKERPPVAGPYLPTAEQAFSFISMNTEPDSVIVFFKPRAMKLFTGRQAIVIKKADQLNRGDYLCVYLRKDASSQLTSNDIARFLGEGRLRQMYENVDFRVYRINKDQDTLEVSYGSGPILLPGAEIQLPIVRAMDSLLGR